MPRRTAWQWEDRNRKASNGWARADRAGWKAGGGTNSKRLGSSWVEVENTPLVGDVLEYMGFYRVLWRGG